MSKEKGSEINPRITPAVTGSVKRDDPTKKLKS